MEQLAFMRDAAGTDLIRYNKPPGPASPVDLKRVCKGAPLKALAQHQLEDVARLQGEEGGGGRSAVHAVNRAPAAGQAGMHHRASGQQHLPRPVCPTARRQARMTQTPHMCVHTSPPPAATPMHTHTTASATHRHPPQPAPGCTPLSPPPPPETPPCSCCWWRCAAAGSGSATPAGHRRRRRAGRAEPRDPGAGSRRRRRLLLRWARRCRARRCCRAGRRHTRLMRCIAVRSSCATAACPPCR